MLKESLDKIKSLVVKQEGKENKKKKAQEGK